jgi:hypothetical protein
MQLDKIIQLHLAQLSNRGIRYDRGGVRNLPSRYQTHVADKPELGYSAFTASSLHLSVASLTEKGCGGRVDRAGRSDLFASTVREL